MPPRPPSPYFQDFQQQQQQQQRLQRLQQHKHQRYRPPKTIYNGRPCVYTNAAVPFTFMGRTKHLGNFSYRCFGLLRSTHLAHPYLPNLPRKCFPSGRETCIADRFV
ncbi:unnamed protein product [Ectocarpus sp. 6 AP-2014]